MARENNETTVSATDKLEASFQAALRRSGGEWRLGRDSTPGIVLICGWCGLLKTFPDRKAALAFLRSRVECERCTSSDPIPEGDATDVAA